MNYANPPYPQNPPYPGYPPQNYARPKKKNELWFVLAGVFLILYVVVFELSQMAYYAEKGRTLSEVFSSYSAENCVSLAGRVILLVFGAICMAFRRNHGVLVTFSGVLAFTELCTLICSFSEIFTKNGSFWYYYLIWFVRSELSILIWFFLAVLIFKNLHQREHGTAFFFIALCLIMVYAGVELNRYTDSFGNYLSFDDFPPYTYWRTVLSYVNLFAAQVLLIFAAYMPNKVTFEPVSTVAHAPMQPPMPPYAPNTQPQSSTPMNQTPYAPSPAQPAQPTQPSAPFYPNEPVQTAPVQQAASVQPTAPVQQTAPIQPTAPTAEAVPVSPYADAPTVVVAPTAPTAPIPQAAPTSPASPARTVDVSAQLRSLQTLLEQGVITEGEYTARKNRLLGL